MNKAVELSEKEDEAGQALTELYLEAKQLSLAVSLWKDITGRNPKAVWAWKRYAYIHAR